MNAENNNLCTPKHTKRLGLSRNSSKQKKCAKKLTGSAGVDCRVLETETTNVTPKSRFPQSDIKINYKCLESASSSRNMGDGESIPATPNNTSSTDLHRLALSTNCRPYRLALSKKIREKMTKKRLEFYLANEIEKEETKEKEMATNAHPHNLETEKIYDSRKALLDKIEFAKKELAACQDHNRKVEELKQTIELWKTGFASAFHDLQQKVEPRIETAELLERLHIPQEMIKYINE